MKSSKFRFIVLLRYLCALHKQAADRVLGKVPSQSSACLVMPLIRIARSPRHSHKGSGARVSSASTPSKSRLLRQTQNQQQFSDMNTIRSTSSDKSSSKRSTASSRSHRSRSRSKSQENHFQMQHDNMMSRQQFRTNTSRSVSRNRGKIPREVNGPPSSIHGTQSYDSGKSGYSHISRKSDAIPMTIQRPETELGAKRRDENIHNVKIIIAGENIYSFFI